MIGTVAVTDQGWWDLLSQRPDLQEVNFWRPSARRRFSAPEFSPFLFKLRAPHNAICGFGYFAGWHPLPIWLAWETFGEGNGCASLAEMRGRLEAIRKRIRYRPEDKGTHDIGCTLIVQPVFFPKAAWVRQPADWHARTQTDKKYDLAEGEGRRVWQDCLGAVRSMPAPGSTGRQYVAVPQTRYGDEVLVRTRLGQGTFRIAVTEAYERACAITGEHSLPALDAGHIQPFAAGGPHRVSNGVLLRADLHRLFDKGYVTVTPDLRVEVSRRLRQEFQNGRSYYPLHGRQLRVPKRALDRPDPEALRWHNEHVFAV